MTATPELHARRPWLWRRRRPSRSTSAARQRWLGISGAIIVVLIVILAAVGPALIGINPNQQSLSDRLLAPNSTGSAGTLHLLGTDALGRDVLARLAAGARASMGVVVVALLLGAGIGVVLGVLAGFYGKWVDAVIMRAVDVQLSIPTLLAAMFVAALLGGGFWNTALTLGLTSWPIYARLVRADVLVLRHSDFIKAGVVLGATDRWLMLKHVLPNLLGSLCVVASLELGSMVLTESSLSFIGLGMQPPNASWGSMINEGQAYIHDAWWLSVVPGVLIMFTVLAFNLLGDWLRDVLDPRR